MHVFHKILVPNLIDNYYLVKFRRYAPVVPSFTLAVQFYVLIVSNLSVTWFRRTSGMAQTSFGNGSIEKSSTIFIDREAGRQCAWWHPSVCLSLRLSALPSAAMSNNHHYQSKVIVCVSIVCLYG